MTLGFAAVVMPSTPENSTVLRFGVFEANLRARELRRSGARVKLQDQPFQILAMLLERPGEVVTREEIKSRLWSDEVFVDFDLSLNSAVKKLRNALGDDSDNPRFIETLYRRGYRFIAPVSAQRHESGAAQVQKSQSGMLDEAARASQTAVRQNWILGGLLSVALLPVLVWVGFRLSNPAAPRVTMYTQITHDGQAKGFQSFVTDGPRLYTRESLLSKMVPIEVAAGGGDTSILPLPFGASIDDIATDGSVLLMRATQTTSNDSPVWRLPLPSGPPARVGDLAAHWTAWSPRTGDLVFSKGESIFVARGDGTGARKLIDTDGAAEDLRVSADGAKLRFTLVKKGTTSLWEVNSDGTGLRPLISEWNGVSQECCGNWTPDRKFFVFQRLWNGKSDLWALPERHSWFGNARPMRLTNGPIDFTLPLPSKDGTKIFTVGVQRRAELTRYDAKTGFNSFLGGISGEGLAFSPDGLWVVYVSVPDGAIWRSKVDGTERLQLTDGSSMRGLMPSWSPDGREIVFAAQTNRAGFHPYIVSAQGGPARELIPGAEFGGDPVWSSDGKFVLVTLHDPFRQSGGISIFDLAKKTMSDLPGSENFFAPRCSPDGKFLTATITNSSKLMLLDRSAAQWTKLVDVPGLVVAYPNWSHDSKYVYFQGLLPGDQAIFRVRVSDRKLEKVVDLKGIRQYWGDAFQWFALAPDDSVLITRDVSSQEIYALDLQAR